VTSVTSPAVGGSLCTACTNNVEGRASVRRICSSSTNYSTMVTKLCLQRSSLTAFNFSRHFRRLRSITVCAIELISSIYRTAMDVLWIVTFNTVSQKIDPTLKRYSSKL